MSNNEAQGYLIKYISMILKNYVKDFSNNNVAKFNLVFNN